MIKTGITGRQEICKLEYQMFKQLQNDPRYANDIDGLMRVVKERVRLDMVADTKFLMSSLCPLEYDPELTLGSNWHDVEEEFTEDYNEDDDL